MDDVKWTSVHLCKTAGSACLPAVLGQQVVVFKSKTQLHVEPEGDRVVRLLVSKQTWIIRLL